MFAIDVICDFGHIHVVQAFVLKPLKAGTGCLTDWIKDLQVMRLIKFVQKQQIS